MLVPAGSWALQPHSVRCFKAALASTSPGTPKCTQSDTRSPEAVQMLQPPAKEAGFENSKHARKLPRALNFSVTVNARGGVQQAAPASP